jgi:hypothetical protein
VTVTTGVAPTRWSGRAAPVAVYAVAAAALVPLVVAQPALAVVAVLVLGAATVAFLHPPAAAYLLIATGPLLAGMDRGAVIPVLRPNEAVALLLGTAVVARRLVDRRERSITPGRRLTSAEGSMLLLVVAGTVLPLLTMMLRGRAITQVDVFYALVLAKLLGIYLLVRTTIRTDRQVLTCLFVAMAAASVTAIVGLLQALRLFGVPAVISRFFAPEGLASVDASRWGTSTIGHAQAMGDLMAFSLAIALVWVSRSLPARRLVVAFIALFVLGAVTSAEFSSVIAVAIAALTVAIVTGNFRKSVLRLLPFVIVAAVVLQPVIRSRLDEFSAPGGVPPSWTARVHNLETYVIPELAKDYNFVLGVRPSPVVTKRTDPVRTGFIESGHLWYLWTGGIPFLIAFVVFMVANIRVTYRVGRRCRGPVGMAGVASLAALTVVLILTTFDPHLTFRGSGELNVSLLALAHLGIRSRPRQGEPAAGAPGQWTRRPDGGRSRRGSRPPIGPPPAAHRAC